MSICLNNILISSDIKSATEPDNKIFVLYYFVAAISLLARLTWGDKYEASILWFDPIAPSIAQPKLRPKPNEGFNSSSYFYLNEVKH